MSKSIQVIALPTLTTNGDISPWKTILETIGFTVDTTTGVALWKNSTFGIKISSAHCITCTSSGSINAQTIYGSIINKTNVVMRYIRYNENDIGFSIRDAQSDIAINYFICTDGTDWHLISNGTLYSTIGSGYINSGDNFSRSLGYNLADVCLVPYRFRTIVVPNMYIAVYFIDGGATIKVYVGNTGNKQYLLCHVGSYSYSPTYAIDADAIWDDSDYPVIPEQE